MNFQKPSQQVSIPSHVTKNIHLHKQQEMVQVGPYPARIATKINSR
jgi:hypothetical protein